MIDHRSAVPVTRKCLSLLVASLILTATCFAQIKSATIVGRVTDTTGASIPAATVSVVNQGTAVVTTAVTDPSGNFAVPYLEPGTYTVNVEKPGSGFARHSTVNLSLSTAQTVKLEIALQVQSLQQAVTVSADQAAIQTSSATVQSAIDERTIDTIPNITHNAFSYAALQPGVVPRGLFGDTQTTQSFGIGIDGRRQASAIGINGGAAFSNDIILDGVSIQGSAWNETAVLPNQDSLQEVKTVTNNYSAEYGRAQGVVILTTKSGGNGYHGSGFYRVRNDAFNANSYSNNAQNIQRPAFKSNTFGASLGGRIIRDKAFFFVSYEGLRFHHSYDYLLTVPTAAERAGDFSQTYVSTPTGPQLVKIYDPFNVTLKPGSTTVYNRALLPSNLALIGRINPFGQAILNSYPLPNRTPDDIFNKNNFFLRGNQQFNKDDFNSRLDFHWGKQNFYTTYGFQKGNIATPRSWGQNNPYYSRKEFVGNQQPDNNFYVALGDTVPLSTNLILDARLGVNRIEADDLADSFPDYNYDQFGIPKAVQAIDVIPGAPPAFSPAGTMSPLNLGTSLHKRERQTNTDFNASVTWTRGRWTHKFGGTYRVLLSNYIDVEDSVQIQTGPEYTRQNINFDGSTGGLTTPDASYNGLSTASILLGAGNLHISPGFQLRLALAQKYYALYSQNDWRATDRLTFNLGLRWDVQPGPTERHDRTTVIDLTGHEPLFGTAGAVVFPGHNGADRHMWRTRYNNFGPRFGAAYQITPSAVVRGGYGVTYVPSNTGFNDGPGFYGAAPYTPSVIGYAYGTAPAGKVIVPFYDPSINPISTPIGANPLDPGIYGGARRFPNNYKNGFVEQWNLFLEQKVGANWNFAIGYIGSHGRNLQVAYTPINSVQLIDPAQLASWRAAYIASNGANPATAQICNPYQTLQTCNPANPKNASGPLIPYGNGNIKNRTIALQESLFPYPLEGDNIHLSTGVSDYNALQLQVAHNFSSGLQLSAHYTWSKLLGDTRYNAQTNQGYSDGGDRNYFPYLRPEMKHFNRQLTTNDVPHRVVLNWVYDLPFGEGRKFFNSQSWVNQLIGGWRLGGVFTAQTGFVIPIAAASGGITNSINGLPDRVPGVPLEVPKNLQHWYDGKTSVTLPSGRVVTPCANCFFKYNIDAFAGRTVLGADGKTLLPDVFWYGDAPQTYGDMRSNPIWNTNMALEKSFRIRERYSLSISGQATNLFNNTQFKPLNSSFFNLGATILSSANPNLVGKLQDSNNTFGTYGRSTYDARQLEMVVQFKF